jgi:hypothetical protein
VLSKLPIGALTSWQHAIHPGDPAERVFSRDLLEVEILHPTQGSRLFTVFNNHLKSQFVPFNQDPVAGREANDDRRHRQAETVERIVAARTRPDSRFVVVGDHTPAHLRARKPRSEPLTQPLELCRRALDLRQHPVHQPTPRPGQRASRLPGSHVRPQY